MAEKRIEDDAKAKKVEVMVDNSLEALLGRLLSTFEKSAEAEHAANLASIKAETKVFITGMIILGAIVITAISAGILLGDSGIIRDLVIAFISASGGFTAGRFSGRKNQP